MPLYLDRHDLVGSPFENATTDAFLQAHQCDLKEQGRFGVRYLTYWWHAGAKTAFCLVEAPSREAAEAVHLAAHGELAVRIIEVDWDILESFLGRVVFAPTDSIREDTAFRTILCSMLVGPEGPSRSQTGIAGQYVLDDAVFESRGGSKVMEGQDGVVACFPSLQGALECALVIKDSFVPIASLYQSKPVGVRIGISFGEPVMTHAGLFGDTVEDASRLCREADIGEILVSSSIEENPASKAFKFRSREGRSSPAFSLAGRVELESWPRHSDVYEPQPSHLSTREVEVLCLLASGKTNQEIASNLFISNSTVATHIRRIFQKTEVSNRAEAASYAVRHRLI